MPGELVTASASGLDPHISPGGGAAGRCRAWPGRAVVAPERVTAVVEARSRGGTLGLLGEPRVNVLMLNLALDRQFGEGRQGRRCDERVRCNERVW